MLCSKVQRTPASSLRTKDEFPTLLTGHKPLQFATKPIECVSMNECFTKLRFSLWKTVGKCAVFNPFVEWNLK